MTANRAWIKQNLGFNPIEVQVPPSTFAFKAAAMRGAELEDMQREIE